MIRLPLATALCALMAGPVLAADLRIGLQDDPDVLDPAQSRTFVGRIVYTAMCDKLVDLTPEVDFAPQLATDWAYSDDGMKLVMNLREGVVFHDGEPMDAEAVVYTINRNMTLPESRRKSELSSVASIEATGPLQVTFNLNAPDSSLVAQLSDRAGIIISPKAGEELGANFGSAPVCAGPFKFVERIQQDRIVLEKFADYWDADNIHIDRVTYLPIPDTTVRLANLRSGELDMMERVAAPDVAALEGASDIAMQESVGLGYMAIYNNIANGPQADNPFGQDARIRQAFSLAIDREALNQVVFEGTARAGNQPFPPNSRWFDQENPVPARDLEAAKALLAEAGHERLSLTIQHANNPVVTQMMQVIQAMVSEAGFDVQLRATEFATLLSEQSAGNFQLSRSDWSGRPDPDGNLHQFVTCEGGINDPKYCNAEVDEHLNAARATTDFDTRKGHYDAAGAILAEDLPIIYLGHQTYIFAMDTDVEGFTAYPDGMIRLQGVTKTE
ncbi:ABC transporter substrate-binding protein [Falsirhodobacter halotolerans]|uniref:ABC transporter substrate-binding protein n=1 Tax=Falsirhodobacter halotolerans TaxID=1146892 RepID=UPI001FD5D3F7|nr:ABC transporter substrate-binding protein [Falsirhodobacter halotolerans]MCJ8140843.1 ABC transporter substrate-binding protein [Falsirhodobacter halotolerans]